MKSAIIDCWLAPRLFSSVTLVTSYSKTHIISTTFTDTEVNNCFSIYRTSWITNGPKSNFICENIAAKEQLDKSPFVFLRLLGGELYLANHLRASQSARAKSTIHFVWYILITLIYCLLQLNWVNVDSNIWGAGQKAIKTTSLHGTTCS